MSVKEAFDIYFAKLKNSADFLRKAPYTEKLGLTGLFLPDTLDAEVYAEWRPVLQDRPVDFEKAEKELGFAISGQIREYVSAYWFLGLNGHFETESASAGLCLDMITPLTGVEELLTLRFNYEDTNYLKEHNLFMIGGFCCIGGDDGYLVMVNNETDEVTAVQPIEKKTVHLADSVEELLLKMEL